MYTTRLALLWRRRRRWCGRAHKSKTTYYVSLVEHRPMRQRGLGRRLGIAFSPPCPFAVRQELAKIN